MPDSGRTTFAHFAVSVRKRSITTRKSAAPRPRAEVGREVRRAQGILADHDGDLDRLRAQLRREVRAGALVVVQGDAPLLVEVGDHGRGSSAAA